MNFARLLIPGLVFQAVVAGGGYATGRELVQFFMEGSLATGLAGMAVTAIVWGIVLAVALENARMISSSDYRTFLRSVIGPFWIAYDACFILLLVLVLSVLAAAAGEIVHSRLGLPNAFGAAFLMLLVSLLTFFGSRLIERFLTLWSALLFIVFAAILALSLVRFSPTIAENFAAAGVDQHYGWLRQGVAYAGYNLAVIPGILYCVRHLQSRRDAIVAGLLGGVLAIVPAVLFFCAMAAAYPKIKAAPVPVELVLQGLNMPWLSMAFHVVLFGIFVKTGAALLHALNDRVSSAVVERGGRLGSWSRAAIALAVMGLSWLLSQGVGIIDLVARGYGLLTIAFLVVFVLPLLVFGSLRIWRTRSRPLQV